MMKTLLLTYLDGTRVFVGRPFHTGPIEATPKCPSPVGTRLFFGIGRPEHIDVTETVEQIAYAMWALEPAELEPARLRYVAERGADAKR